MKSIHAAFGTAMLIFAWLFVLPNSIWAHGGEDHAAEKPVPNASISINPRAYAQSNDVESVVVLSNGELTVYLDRYDTNEPIASATVEVDTGNQTMVATAKGEGVYVAYLNTLKNPGTYNLVISVQTENLLDLLTTTLVVTQQGH